MVISDPSLAAVLNTKQLYFRQLLFLAACREPSFSAIDNSGIDDLPEFAAAFPTVSNIAASRSGPSSISSTSNRRLFINAEVSKSFDSAFFPPLIFWSIRKCSIPTIASWLAMLTLISGLSALESTSPESLRAAFARGPPDKRQSDRTSSRTFASCAPLSLVLPCVNRAPPVSTSFFARDSEPKDSPKCGNAAPWSRSWPYRRPTRHHNPLEVLPPPMIPRFAHVPVTPKRPACGLTS